MIKSLFKIVVLSAVIAIGTVTSTITHTDKASAATLQTATTTAGDGLNVRPTPGMTKAPVQKLPKGYLVRVLAIKSNGWVMIAEGKYVHSAYLKSTDGKAIGSSLKRHAPTVNQTATSAPSKYSSIRLSASDRDLLARLVRAESGGESFTGQVAVAQVVLNRVLSNRFPSTVRGVIYQKRQFSPVMNGSINRPANAQQFKAVDYALRNGDVTSGALFFYAPKYVRSPYMESLRHIKVIGVHHFKTFR